MIRLKKSVNFEKKCGEIEFAMLKSVENIEDYNNDHLRHVYLGLLKSLIDREERTRYYKGDD